MEQKGRIPDHARDPALGPSLTQEQELAIEDGRLNPKPPAPWGKCASCGGTGHNPPPWPTTPEGWSMLEVFSPATAALMRRAEAEWRASVGGGE